MQIYNYQAGAGDCLRLRFSGHNVLIDTGVTRFGPRFASICQKMQAAGEKIDALLLTHADADHIGGLLYCLRNQIRLPVREVWMNHRRWSVGNTDLSVRQNDEVYSRLRACQIPVLPVTAGMEHKIGEAIFRMLAPDAAAMTLPEPEYRSIPLRVRFDYDYPMEILMEKPIIRKDTSPSNRASVVMEVLFAGRKILFTGDAWPEDVRKVAQDIYDLIKLPHHGSAGNLSESWQQIRCNQFILCTDGKNHPDKQTIAKLLKWNPQARFYGSLPWWKQMLCEQEKIYEEHFVEGEEIQWLMAERI